jgi:hypothetical protein
VKEIHVSLNKRPGPLQKGDNRKKCKNGVGSFENIILKPEKLNFT